MKVNLEGRIWLVTDEKQRPQGYFYRRRLPIFEKGIRKYEDIRRQLGSNLDRARAEAARLDTQYDEKEQGLEVRRDATLSEFWEWYVKHVRDRNLLGWKTIRDNTGALVRYLCESKDSKKEKREDILLRRITRADVAQFFEAPREKLVSKKDEKSKVLSGAMVSQATVFSCFRHVRRMFRVARDNRFLDPGGPLPTDGISVRAPKLEEPRLPEPSDVRLILDWLKKERPWIYRVILGLVFTGARVSEILGLTWDRVGFVKPEKDNSLTLIRRKVGDKLTIPMADLLQRELFAMWIDEGQPLQSYVFHTKSGRAIGKYQAYKAFKREVKKLGRGLEYVRLKDFRKLAATYPEMWDAVRLLGHSSPQMTAKH